MNFDDTRVLKSGTQNVPKFLASANSRTENVDIRKIQKNRSHLEIIHGYIRVVGGTPLFTRGEKVHFRVIYIQHAYVRIINDVINNKEDHTNP